jgi:hypothetical protein
MSLIVGKGVMITVMETEVCCPVCTFKFDVGEKSEKSKYPAFSMKCPGCKSKLSILMPVFGGQTIVREFSVPENVERLQTVSEFKVTKMSKKVEKLPADQHDLKVISKLSGVTILPGTWNKRFVNSIIHETMLSEVQRDYVYKLFYTYRKQIRDYTQIFNNLPPEKQALCNPIHPK